MSDRAARIVLGLVVAGLFAAAYRTRIPQFWGDGATYHAMAWSLAEDGDLRYEPGDIFRVRREFPSGPQGLFLKRASGGLAFDAPGFPWIRRVPDAEPRLYYAKPFAYSVAAAPLVRVLGTKGLFLTNAVFLALALVLGYAVRRPGTTPGRALALSVALFLGTVAPVYLFWPAPEVFNLGVVTAGLVAWRSNRPLLSAVLLGIATYSKPYNLWLALPLGLAPLFGAEGGSGEAAPTGRPRHWQRLREAARRGLVVAGTTVLLFAVNIAITGEWNYQGGRERKTFYGDFPFEMHDGREVTFGNSGIWMSTNQLGPRVEGRDEQAPAQGAEPPRSAAELKAALLRNLYYFWVGRFGGAVPYFFPAVLAAAVFLFLGPRSTAGWLALLALLVSWLFYLERIPDNWYGGSGTVGNRYFLNLLPLALLLVPAGRERLVAVGGALATAVFTAPLLIAPIDHSLRPGRHAMQGAFRLLPAELTMLNDLSIFAERWRWKRPFGDTEGDAHKNWPADPKAYWLYFPDDGTYGKESFGETEGFWLRGGRDAEIFLRALEPVRQVRFRVTGGPSGDEARIRLGGREGSTTVGPRETRELALEPGPPFVYKDSFVYILNLRSTRSGLAAGPDGTEPARPLGAFVQISLEVQKRR